jgi:hypothetical protein
LLLSAYQRKHRIAHLPLMLNHSVDIRHPFLANQSGAQGPNAFKLEVWRLFRADTLPCLS